MSTKINKCEKCDSFDIKEINPEIREESNKILCNIKCECLSCGNIFNIKSWTRSGKRKGVKY